MNKITKQTLFLLWRHARRYPWHLFVIMLGVALVVAVDLTQPFIIKQLIDSLAQGPSAADTAFRAVVLFLLLSVVNDTLWRVVGYTNNYFQPRIISDLMNTGYHYIQGHSSGFFDNTFVGSLVAKIRRQGQSFERLSDTFIYNIWQTVLRVLVILMVFLAYKPIIGLYMLVWVIAYIGLAYWFALRKYPYDEQKAKQDTLTTAHLADTITNHQNLKLFASHRREVAQFESITDKLFRLRKKSWDVGQNQEVLQSISMIALEAFVFLTAFRLWQDGQFSVGDFAFVQAYLLSLFMNLWNIGRHIRTVYESIADANEMTEIMLKPHAIVDSASAKPLQVTAGKIEFQNMGFEYISGTPVIENFNLTILPGERVALVGESGGGKSTIVKTLLRFVDLTSGKIVIDGQDIASVTQDSLREQISLVPQEPILFHRSLMENIRYGKPEATEEEVIAAAKAAHCHEFITSLEKGYETLVGERGVKLSGGERQRVAIARAILRNSPILILDEATSSLDSESESYIQEALQTLMKDKTTIVVAHRLSTIKAMDRIVVISSGKIIEEGKHEELLKAQQGQYQKLWDIQVGGFAQNAHG